MWAWIEEDQRCCLDLPNTRTVSPDWMSNGTFLGIDNIMGTKCYHWKKEPHDYWNSVAQPEITCKFAFPRNPSQDMYFNIPTFMKGPIEPYLFDLPPYCVNSCK